MINPYFLIVAVVFLGAGGSALCVLVFNLYDARVKTQTKKKKKLPTDKTIQVKLPNRIRVQLTRTAVNEKHEETRVLSSSFKVRWRGRQFFQRGMALYFIDPRRISKETTGEMKLVYDTDYCEPLIVKGDGTTEVKRSEVVSMILRDEVMNELIVIAQTILPIQISKTMASTVIVFAVMAGFITLAISPLVAPATSVHWVTSAPSVFP